MARKDWYISFKDFVKQEGCTVLSDEQRNAVLKGIHPFMASAGKIAVGNGYLVIRGGNLEYYAGLEYSRDSKVLTTPEMDVWEVEDSEDDTNHARVYNMALEALKGESPKF